MKKILFLLILFISFVFIGYFYSYKNSSASLTKNENSDLVSNENFITKVTEKFNGSQKSEAEILVEQYGEFAELTVPYLKTAQLDNSPLVIEEELAAGSNYKRYYASYLSGGNKIYGLLTIPNNVEIGKNPGVVFVHGYIPPQVYSTTERYVSYVDYLARNDLIVFKIDLRGHYQSEGEATGSYFSNGYVIDTLNAVSSLKTLEEINPEMISLWGHSMAGNVVTRVIAVDPTIHAASIWAGAVYTYADMSEYGISDSSYRRNDYSDERQKQRETLFAIVGERTVDNPFWQLVSPVEWLKEYQGKIQLHHAVNDSTVSIEYSRNLIRLLEESPVDIELFEYQSGGHDLEGTAFGQAMSRTVEIFSN